MAHGIGFNVYPTFISRILNVAQKKGLQAESLGEVGTGDHIHLLTPKFPDVTRPNVLVAAGFHGDEPGGVYGIARFLSCVSVETLNRVNLSIIPGVNPSGLRLCQRNDFTDADPNRGYCCNERMLVLGEVGQILLENATRLSELARDGFLTLHEDNKLEDAFYVIRNDVTESSNDMLASVIASCERYFKRQRDGLHFEHFITEGCGSWFCDSSFEDMLSHDGIKRLYVLETPELAPVVLRAQCVADVITTFMSHVSSEFKV